MFGAELDKDLRVGTVFHGVLAARVRGELAAKIRADLAEKRVKRKELARLTERSIKTIERWTSDAPEHENYRPTRSEAIVIAYLTGYPVSRYTGDEQDDILFPLVPMKETLSERLRLVEQRVAGSAQTGRKPRGS